MGVERIFSEHCADCFCKDKCISEAQCFLELHQDIIDFSPSLEDELEDGFNTDFGEMEDEKLEVFIIKENKNGTKNGTVPDNEGATY